MSRAAALDLDRLAAWMDTQGLGRGPIGEIVPLTGGTQNILLRFVRAGTAHVLRCPPPGARPEIHASFRREARLLAALARSAVPHPSLVAACDDDAVLGTPFYLMAPVDGFTATPKPLPGRYATDPGWRRAMALSMVDALLCLGEIEPDKVGLADFGRPAGFLERQVPRWLAHLERCAGEPGWPGPHTLPGVQPVADWLQRNIPANTWPGVIHGDYHFGNVMFHHDRPALAAVIDWELATLGDPLLDLGWLLASWPDADGRGAGTIRITPAAGLPTTDELVAHYRARSRRDLSALDWYVTMARFKLGIMLEASHARSCAGKAPAATGAEHHASAAHLLGAALAAVEARG